MKELDEIQEQVNLMYASAKYSEDVHGKNITSIRLRQFADRIGAAITAALTPTPAVPSGAGEPRGAGVAPVDVETKPGA